MRKIAVVAAGGTGGHLFPAQALAEALIARGWGIVLASDERVAGLAQDFPAERRIGLSAATFRPGDPIGMVARRLRRACAAPCRRGRCSTRSTPTWSWASAAIRPRRPWWPPCWTAARR